LFAFVSLFVIIIVLSILNQLFLIIVSGHAAMMVVSFWQPAIVCLFSLIWRIDTHPSLSISYCIVVTTLGAKETRAQSVRPNDLTVFRGQRAVLRCSGNSVRWLYVDPSSGQTVKIFTSPDVWHKDRGNKYEVVGNYDLIIKNAQAGSDAGTYQCYTSASNVVYSANLMVIGNISYIFL